MEPAQEVATQGGGRGAGWITWRNRPGLTVEWVWSLHISEWPLGGQGLNLSWGPLVPHWENVPAAEGPGEA